MTMQQYCLRWNNHQPNFISVFSSLLNSESLVDVTLAAEGKHLQAHKVVLSACSSYFQSLFTINPCQHPIVILKDVKFLDLKVMVDFMYSGQVNVSQVQLPHILKTAEMLKIKGLTEIPVEQSVTKSHNNSTDRAELLTPADTHWSLDGPSRQLSPSPCPLSPSSKRKRLRKSSTGSGSGSTERVPEEHQTNEVTMTSSANIALTGTVIKSDQGSSYTSDSSSTPIKIKQHSSDSELQRGSSHESMEGDSAHPITLLVPQQEMSIPQSIEPSTIDLSGPSTSSSQASITGIQWNVMTHQTQYAQYTSCPSEPPPQHNPVAPQQQNIPKCVITSNTMPLNSPAQPPSPSVSEVGNFQNQITNSPPQMMQKRRRSVNPQADENFVKALEAVRFGGIGFCKAARMYGVNNRTLWLEYKKRGYPNFRLSIKNRKQENPQNIDVNNQRSNSPHVEQIPKHPQEHITPNNHVPMVPNNFFDNKYIDIGPVLQRPKYLDAAIINAQQSLGFPGMSFENM